MLAVLGVPYNPEVLPDEWCRRTVSAAVLGVILIIGGACKRAERAAEEAARVTEETATAVFNARAEKELSAAFSKLQGVAGRADVATLYRIANQFDADYAAVAAQGRGKIAGYPVRNQMPVTREAAQSLVTVLTDRKTYFPPGDGWTCMFEPHDVLSLTAGNEAVAVVICTQCGDVDFFVGGKRMAGHSVLAGPNAKLSRMLNEMRSARTR